MNTSTTTSIRVFTYDGLPAKDAIEAQAIEFATDHGLAIELIDIDSCAAELRAGGVMGLPAIVAYDGITEIARRECAFAGRSTRRWMERKVASPTLSPALTPAMA